MVAWLDAQAAMELTGDLDSALVHSQEAVEIGNRLGDAKVQMLGLATQGSSGQTGQGR
jgi:hypothetical protein